MIQLENIFKIYTMGDTEVFALNDVSLHIKEKEFVSIIRSIWFTENQL